MKKNTVILLVALLCSILLNFIIYSDHKRALRLWGLGRFFSSQPTEEATIDKFGSPIEHFKNSTAIQPSGWTLPPWKTEDRVVVFEVYYEYRVYVAVGRDGKISAYWIGTS